MGTRQPGAVLDGKYEVLRQLAAGGMGEVYLVRHLHLEEQRVVKVLRQDIASDPTHRKRFLREARLATQIKHPNVAILYDFAQLPEGPFYMVWEHVEGREVGQWLRERGPFPIPLALELAVQSLRGLEAIHALGVVHRDVSPDNLMIARDLRGRPRMKVIDLGLAKTLEPDPNFEVTQAGMFMGKLRYCSPEQADTGGDSLDRRSDLYSFALVLYEMITGVSPWNDSSKPAFVFKRLSEDPLPMVGRVPGLDVPVALDQVIRKALERDRDQRFADAIAFMAALDQVANALGDHATQRMQIPAFATEPPAPPAAREASRTSAELTSDERRDLLDQIDRAARRLRETTQATHRVEMAIQAGRLDEAGRILAELEASHPTARGLAEMRQKWTAAVESGRSGQRISELEQMLTGYLKKKQLPLAELALESLLELSPIHPRVADFRSWIGLLRDELHQDRRVAESLAAGRAALQTGDARGARKAHEALKKADPSGDAAAAFAAEMDKATADRKHTTDVETHRRRFEEAVDRGRLDEAERELTIVGRMGATKVTLDFLQRRLDEGRAKTAAHERAGLLEREYAAYLAAGDFAAARETALVYGREVPKSPKPAAMFAETANVEEASRRRKAIEEGERQVEELLRVGRTGQAGIALKILLRIDPHNRKAKQFEKQMQPVDSAG